MQETISADKESIERLTKHKQTALLLLGSLEAENDVYKARQAKIQVISQEKSAQFDTKGAETMRKHCYKRSDGRWQYSRQEAGKRYYAIASTYRELLEKIPTIKPKIIKNIKHTNRQTRQNTFVQYFEYYLDNYVNNKKISQDTKTDWKRQFDKDIVPFFRYKQLDELTTEDIQNFIDSIQFERKQETIFQRISKVLNKAYATGKMKRNITVGLEKPKRQNFQERPPLTLHEQIQLLKFVKGTRLYAFTVFSIIVGSRREETQRFDLSEDVDMRKCLIHIKGTKTNNADRYVHVTKEFISFLKTNMKGNSFELHASTYTHELGSIFKKLRVKNGCLHSLRHTCSANLYFLGANDKYRQMQLGHASMITTNDIYTNIKENIPKRWLRLLYGDLYPKFD